MYKPIRDFRAGDGCVFRVAQMDRGYSVRLWDLEAGQPFEVFHLYPTLPQAIARARDLSEQAKRYE